MGPFYGRESNAKGCLRHLGEPRECWGILGSLGEA